MDEFIQSFINETQGLLSELEHDLLEIEKNPKNKQIVDKIFRAVHTLKGSASMFGFSNIQDLSHEFESIYDLVRQNKLEITPDLIDLTLKVKDVLQNMLLNKEVEKEVLSIKETLNKEFSKSKVKGLEENIEELVNTENSNENIFGIVLKPDKNVFERGVNPENVLNEISNSGKSKIIIHEGGQSWEEQVNTKVCKAIWEIYLRTTLPEDEIKFIFMFFDEDEYVIEKITEKSQNQDGPFIQKLLEIYPDYENVEMQIEMSIKKITDLSDKITESPLNSIDEERTKKEEIQEKIIEKSIKSSEQFSFINVSSTKIDELLNLVSELVTSSAVLHNLGERILDEELTESIEHIEKLTKQFRNNALYLRLIPLKTLKPKFNRQIRDLSKELGKEVNFIFEDHDAEIDKSILDAIEKPLVHIIRNSIDHGIEDPEERKRGNKSPRGLLKISSFYSGANVVIQIQDDGRGINLERVKECAITKGYIDKNQITTDKELLSLIMEPGFSTKDEVSMVSGRGVGMDVVKKELMQVKGSLEVETEKGLGTYITLKLPTTLSIIDALMIEVMGTNYLLPLLEVDFCYNCPSGEVFSNENQCIRYQSDYIPYVSLREKFNKTSEYNSEVVVVIINKYDKKYALIVDYILGEYQAVIKNMGVLFSNQPYFSGGNIMANGKIALIIDTNYIFNQVAQIN